MGKSSKKSSVEAAPVAVSVPEGKSVKKGKAFDSSLLHWNTCWLCFCLVALYVPHLSQCHKSFFNLNEQGREMQKMRSRRP